MTPQLMSPIETVIQIIHAVWTVYVVGTFRAIPRFARWVGSGDWFAITMKLGVVFLMLILARSMWARLADVGDGNPMVPVIAVALLLSVAIAALVGTSTGLWNPF